MKKLLAIAVLLAVAMTAQAKVGETKVQIIKRFGAAAIVHEQSNVEGDYITFEGKNHVLVLFQNSRSICEVYLLRTGYSASDANEIVKTVLAGVRRRWNELDAWRKRSTDGVYEIMLLPTNGRGTYKWGIAVGHSVTVASFGELMAKTDQAAVVPKPQPQTADPNRTPND